MRRFAKVVVFFVVVGVIGFAVLAGVLVYLAKTRTPMLDGELTCPALQAEVRVARDDWGVPHIEAQTEPDAFFALGYVTAQDRLFQMELILRLARGELSELVGPVALPVDRIARSFRLRRKAEHAVAERRGYSDGMMAAAEAYVAGVNGRVSHEPLPFEFAVLGIPARTYTVADCLTVASVLPVTFADGLRTDPLVSVLKERCPNLDIDALFPGYSKEVPVTIMETLEEAAAHTGRMEAPRNARAAHEQAKLEGPILDFLDGLCSLTHLFGPALGSNSWVLDGTRTKSGKPLLANDPHIGFMNPSVWYEAHVSYEGGDLHGHYFPLVPFALLGQNERFAWALTMFANDDVDLYRETFDPANPRKVMYKGEWADVTEEKETIRVRFWPDQEHTVRSTPHGPVLTDLFRRFQGYEGADIALTWSWQHVDYTDPQAFYEMGRAQNYDEFAKGVGLITSPGLNISYADAEGNIAWWAAGVIAVRPPHVNHKEILDGASGKDETLGFVPVEQNPHVKNPPCGYIVTANNLTTVKPVGPVPELQGYWQPGDRAARIEELLESRADWDIETMKPVQFDDVAHSAPMVLEAALAAIAGAREGLSPVEEEALACLESWDGAHGVDSCGASIFEAFCDAILENAIEDEIGERLFDVYNTSADRWSFFKHLIQEEGSPWWDDQKTESVESREDIVSRSFRECVSTLTDRLGKRVDAWRWGRLHTMEFKHAFGYVPLLGRIFNVGPFPSSGAHHVINNMLNVPGGANYEVIAGPSTRRLIDFGEPDRPLGVLPTGNSGIFTSPNYGNQAPLFMAGQYREVCVTPEQIKAHQQHELRLVPAPRPRP